MSILLIENARVWDGTGREPFPGAVLVDGNRIAAVAPAGEPIAADGARRVDAGGKFLMPGMVEGHAHPSFADLARAPALGELPPEEHTLITMDNARKLLGAGFTSACSAASAKIRLDVVVRDAIRDGLCEGPRLLAASPEITVTGGLSDARRLHQDQQSFGLVADGPDEMRRRGIRVVIGGDYGFDANPQGTNARDLEHFVTHFGFTPSEALQAATRIGGEIMLMGDELGLVREGYLADLLLVDGDPLADVRVLQDGARLAMIMKDGVRYARCEGAPHVRRVEE